MAMRGDQLSAGASLAGLLVALLPMAEGVALGANGPLLALLASMAELVVAVAVLLAVPPEARFWREAWPVLVLLGVACGWAALPVLFPAADPLAPDLRLAGLARLAGSCATVLAAGIAGFRRGLARRTVDWLIAAGLVQIATGLVLRALDPEQVWGFAHSITGPRFSGTMINANANAVVAAVTAVLAFGRAQSFLREGPAVRLGEAVLRIGCVLAVVAAVGACVLSGSRAAMFLTVAAVAGLVALDPVYRAWLSRPLGFLSAAAALAALALILAVAGAPAIARLVTFTQDSVGRLDIWRHYGRLALSAPPFGYGSAAFSELNGATLVGVRQAAEFWYVNSAHNQPIELVLEGGAVYAAAILFAVLAMAVAAVRQVLRSRDDPVMRAVLAALATVAGASLVDIALDVPAVVTLAATLLALAWGRGMRARSAPTRRRPG